MKGNFLGFLFLKKLQAKLLCPLQELSSSTHADVRQKQLDCVLLILQNNGEQLNEGWPLVLGVIGAITNNQGYIFIADCVIERHVNVKLTCCKYFFLIVEYSLLPLLHGFLKL